MLKQQRVRQQFEAGLTHAQKYEMRVAKAQTALRVSNTALCKLINKHSRR